MDAYFDGLLVNVFFFFDSVRRVAIGVNEMLNIKSITFFHSSFCVFSKQVSFRDARLVSTMKNERWRTKSQTVVVNTRVRVRDKIT
jgi:hypothetical protein